MAKTSLPFRTDQRLVCSSVSKLSCQARISLANLGKINVEITESGLKDDEINITQFFTKSLNLVSVFVFDAVM